MTHKLTTKFGRRTVQFASGDSYCSAWLNLPDTASGTPVPVVVMGHGLGATREMGLAPYAERFAATGLAVLVFTYRNLGDSGGRPRQVLSMTKQLADWDAALAYAAGLPEVDRQRVAVWGSSLGGGHAIAVAARHPELCAAVAQCPFTDGPASAGALGIRETLVLGGVLARDFLAAARGKEPVTVPVAAAPGQLGLMTAPDALPGMLKLVPDGYEWVNRAAARSLINIVRYRPGRAAKDIAAPILVCISRTDSVAPPVPTERYVRKAPRGDIRHYDAGHFDFYFGKAFEQLVADQTEFLVSHLKPAQVTSG
ncbi:alpha/beta fold hydrolase [Streptomyces sp. NBC_00631]|uniref:alpha/beta hydrolase n=1 Tax=Streptomyces sp. NBC_00631 TaxID=2975793 RepID=UPI0030E5B733